MKSAPSKIGRLLGAVGSLRITVLGLGLLIVLTLWGTLYQAEYGLYRAQVRFYQSWGFLGGGWLPFPGARLIMLLLFANLAASIAALGLARRTRVGMLLTHAGLLLMLAAGAVTFYYGSESQLTLTEGEGANVSAAYHDWELAAWPGDQPQTNRSVSAVDARRLRPGSEIRMEALGLTVHVESFFANSAPTADAADAASILSAERWTALTEARPEKQPEMDRPGALLRLRADGGQETRALVWGGDLRPLIWDDGSSRHALMLRRVRVPLSALIQLIDFEKEFYPGSQIARSYSSKVLVLDGDMKREVLISMNKPLRHKGFTFFQSSYQELPGGRESSTLAVVKNYGRLMPYIATAVTVIGMLLHFSGLLLTRLTRPKGPVEVTT